MKRHLAAIMLLCVAVAGVTPFVPAACSGMKVYDVNTHAWRPMTAQDANAVISVAGPAAATAAAALGQPEWIPVIDLATRLAALVSAWLFTNPWQATKQTNLAVAAALAGNGGTPAAGGG
jgi:hypothetical protein